MICFAVLLFHEVIEIQDVFPFQTPYASLCNIYVVDGKYVGSVTTIYTSSSIPRYHVLFIIAAGGRLGCVTTIDDGSGTQFVAFYNFDAAVNDITTFQFSCAVSCTQL